MMTNSKINFKTSTLESSLCNYSDAYIVFKGTISVTALAPGVVNNDKEVIFKNCVPFSDCISKMNNTQVDNALIRH